MHFSLSKVWRAGPGRVVFCDGTKKVGEASTFLHICTSLVQDWHAALSRVLRVSDPSGSLGGWMKSLGYEAISLGMNGKFCFPLMKKHQPVADLFLSW